MTSAEQVVSQIGNITVTKGMFTCEYCKKDFCLTHNRNHNCLYEEKALREEKLRLTTKLENDTCIAIKVDKI